jgi:hypothetical protein
MAVVSRLLVKLMLEFWLVWNLLSLLLINFTFWPFFIRNAFKDLIDLYLLNVFSNTFSALLAFSIA